MGCQTSTWCLWSQQRCLGDGMRTSSVIIHQHGAVGSGTRRGRQVDADLLGLWGGTEGGYTLDTWYMLRGSDPAQVGEEALHPTTLCPTYSITAHLCSCLHGA